MKRIIAIFISLVLVLSLCACQKDGKDKLTFNTASIEIGTTTDYNMKCNTK